MVKVLWYTNLYILPDLFLPSTMEYRSSAIEMVECYHSDCNQTVDCKQTVAKTEAKDPNSKWGKTKCTDSCDWTHRDLEKKHWHCDEHVPP